VLDGNRIEHTDPYLIREDQKKWLTKSLNETKFPTLIYLHHPIDDQSMENNYYFKNRPQSSCVSNRGEVRSILEKSEKVVAVFNGHTHFFSAQEVNGIRYITVPSFAENNGEHKPNLQFAIATVS